MKRTHILLGALLMALPMSAQDIYKVESFASRDLIGTARYVGMGGAMNALGADLSTLHTNPAAAGLFRRSDVSGTLSMLITPGAESFADIGKTRMSFDQLGFVYSAATGDSGLKFLNFAMNYQKSRNLKNFIGLSNVKLPGGLSQSWQMTNLADYYGQWQDGSNDWVSPIAHTGWNSYMVDVDANDNFVGCDADSYDYTRVQHGGVEAFDFNVSMNFDDQWYLGATIGAYNVNWNSYLLYREALLDEFGGTHPYAMINDEKITGSGFDLKFGFIGRPIEDSPFRFGLSIATPTWFDLTGNNILTMDSPFVNDPNETHTVSGVETGDFDYRVTTPWTFGVSVATTVEDFLALDAEYEYKDYTGASVRYPDGYDPYLGGNMYSHSRKDIAMGNEIDKYLCGVSTFRVGAEVKVADGAYLRAGYNYVSKPFKDDAMMNLYNGFDNNGLGDSDGVINTTGTDYVNLGATNRLTLGVGLRGKHWYGDLGYQYQTQSADVYAFHNFDGTATRTNLLPKQSLDLERHSLTLTVGYKF
ncbi:MAG: hypothetical protein IJ692_06190 [Alloprevotella sp.]|nr:hypothetical protein [Alloprevotella sp.]